MTSIACLGWGSLIWDPRDLPIIGEWRSDGPLLPLEFARQSVQGANADALTLVLVPGTYTKTSALWVPLDVQTPDEARDALRIREGIGLRHREQWIGMWAEKSESPIPAVADWAQSFQLPGVVWTALPPRFEGQNGRVPSVEEAISYLRGLSPEQRYRAERYVRRAPAQIDTPYRRRFVEEFGWTAAPDFA
jgi:hypothetical protein